MNELQHLADTIRRAQEGEAWHGPSLSEVLDGVTPGQASKRLGDTHTIWELTEHIIAWVNIIRRRMEGERLSDEDIRWEDNFPGVPEPTEENWKQTLERAVVANARLRNTVLHFPLEQLETEVPGKDYSYAVMLHGAAQHVIYHAGQIALLKKLIPS